MSDGFNGLGKREQQILSDIAARECNVETLVERKNDSLDFHDIGVCCLRDALAAAFAAGRAAGGAA